MTKEWFSVDKQGLAQILERRGRSFAVLELISNSWDQNVTRVDVTLTPTGKRATYELVVTDDDPAGWADLTESYVLFSPSRKKALAESRGRFNLGEKLVLALCDSATITSTTGAMHFDASGRSALRSRREAGSEFRATLHLNKPDYDATCAVVMTLLPPDGITTTFNGVAVQARDPLHTFKAQLATEIADEEGNLRASTRYTLVSVHDPLPGETATIYEMGIPVVENGDRWHYNVMQKVPLSVDRDNVKPAYLRHLRTLVLNEMHDRITEADANATWAKEAIEDPRVTEQAVRAVVTQRFGDRVVVMDPSDREANNIATSQGYTVIAPRSFSKEAWANIREHEIVLPAGRVTPSNTALLNEHLNGEGTAERIEVPREKWTDGQRRMADYAAALGTQLLGFTPAVQIVSDVTLPALAYYGGRRLALNVGKLGHRWFDQPDQHAVDALLIHEFAHERASNHLDHSFHDECCRLGALLRNVTITLSTMEYAS
jgi:hypothetical protein